MYLTDRCHYNCEQYLIHAVVCTYDLPIHLFLLIAICSLIISSLENGINVSAICNVLELFYMLISEIYFLIFNIKKTCKYIVNVVYIVLYTLVFFAYVACHMTCSFRFKMLTILKVF